MRLIEPKIERLEQKPGFEGLYEIIDLVAGVSHGRDEAHKDPKRFVEKLIDMGHMTPLESGTVTLEITDDYDFECFIDYIEDYKPWVVYTAQGDTNYVTTNFRVLVETTTLEFLKYWCEPTKFHIQRPCFKVVLSRAIADDFVRHRSLSPMMRTSRNERRTFDVTCPRWLKKMFPDVSTDFLWHILEKTENKSVEETIAYNWWHGLLDDKYNYKSLCVLGLLPQDARGVLGPDFATTITLCGFKDVEGQGWDNFIKQRCHQAAHPDAQYVAYQIKSMLDE